LIWTAELDSGGNLDISFSPNIGRPNDHIAVVVDSNGYPIGSYSAQIVINAELEMPGNPTILEVELEVVEDLYSIFLPIASK
jgi:hypothetical protein